MAMGLITLSVGAPYTILVTQHLDLDNTTARYHQIKGPERGRERVGGLCITYILHITYVCLLTSYGYLFYCWLF